MGRVGFGCRAASFRLGFVKKARLRPCPGSGGRGNQRVKVDKEVYMNANMGRRAFLAGVGALAGTAWLPPRSEAQSTKTRLILLGTGGGPRPRKANSASAQVIVAND